MRRITSAVALVTLTVILMVSLDAVARNRIYSPTLGRFLQRDPIGYKGGNNIYEFEGSNPLSNLDPSGLLQRRQVEWLVKSYLGQKGWNIDTAPRLDVRDKVLALKQELIKNFPKGGFDKKDPRWNEDDDIALQDAVDKQRAEKKGPLAGFPGDTFKPMTAMEAHEAVQKAIQVYKAQGGTLAVDETLLLAWAMKESSWNVAASAYGASASEASRDSLVSTAVGAMQTTRDAYVLYAHPPKLGPVFSTRQWSEEMLSDPVASMVVALFMLQNGPGKTIEEKLGGYRGSHDKTANQAYSNRVMLGKSWIEDYFKTHGKSIEKMNVGEGVDFVNRLWNLIRRGM